MSRAGDRAEEAWEKRYLHGKAARTWDAIAREGRTQDQRLYQILAEWMAAYEAADADAERAFRALEAERMPP
jgi:hypothetical protein